MDANGHKKIQDTLREAKVGGFTVAPNLNDAETARFVTISTDRDVPPSLVLNALYGAGLLHREGEERSLSQTSHPVLNPLGVQRGSLTFEDIKEA